MCHGQPPSSLSNQPRQGVLYVIKRDFSIAAFPHVFLTFSPRQVCILEIDHNLRETMTRETYRYLAYMLRLWQVKGDQDLTWCASLESPHTSERRGFASLEALCKFLEEQTRSEEQPAGDWKHTNAATKDESSDDRRGG